MQYYYIENLWDAIKKINKHSASLENTYKGFVINGIHGIEIIV